MVTENFRPGTMDRLGIGWPASATEPPPVYAALSGFGQTGPYSRMVAVDAVAQAMGGTMSLNGEAAGPPMRVGVSIGDMTAGLYLAIGILAALRARDVTGERAARRCLADGIPDGVCETPSSATGAFGESPTRQGSRHPLVAPFGPYPTADGWIVIANVKEWELFAALIGHDDMAVDERFATNRARLENVDALEAELSTAIRERTTSERCPRSSSRRTSAPSAR